MHTVLDAEQATKEVSTEKSNASDITQACPLLQTQIGKATETKEPAKKRWSRILHKPVEDL